MTQFIAHNLPWLHYGNPLMDLNGTDNPLWTCLHWER
jgi:hypothetical protein